MQTLQKRLIAGSAGVFCFGAIAVSLTFVVEYKPWGVPDSRRAEYEAKVSDIKRHTELMKGLISTKRPIAKVPGKTFDFGMLDPHSTATHQFQIVNEGEMPLALEVLETSCKCTVGKLNSNIVEPGQATYVTMTWNTGYQNDEYEQTAVVKTNDPALKQFRLSVRGEIRAEFVVPEVVELNPSDIAELANGSFVVYSQLWDDFTVTSVESELQGFEWAAEPVSLTIPELHDTEPKSAWKIQILGLSNKYGEFEETLTVTVRPSKGDEVKRELTCKGRVRAPIGFFSPNLHRTEGLDLGVVPSGKEQQFHLIVRARGAERRTIKVLDVKPDELRASIAPTSTEGAYRLTITIPENCPMVVFNRDSQHGYVQVGDPEDNGYSNWFPLRGVVSKAK